LVKRVKTFYGARTTLRNFKAREINTSEAGAHAPPVRQLADYANDIGMLKKVGASPSLLKG